MNDDMWVLCFEALRQTSSASQKGAATNQVDGNCFKRPQTDPVNQTRPNKQQIETLN